MTKPLFDRLPFSADSVAFLLIITSYLFGMSLVTQSLSRTAALFAVFPIMIGFLAIVAFGIIVLIRRFGSIGRLRKFNHPKKKKITDCLIVFLGYSIYGYLLFTS